MPVEVLGSSGSDMLLSEVKKIFHKELDARYPVEEVDSFFFLLIDHYFDFPRFVLALDPKRQLTKAQEKPLFHALSELRNHRPVQYIMGSTEFMGLDFLVDENVLIPRPETEELVNWILETYKGHVGDTKDSTASAQGDAAMETQSKREETLMLDIGTGSGCIAVSLAKYLQGSTVYALDVSEPALALAERNAQRNKVDVKTVQADIRTLNDLGLRFDVIVSNPPYVRESEKKQMQANVLDFEPDLALFVLDEDPLIFYEKIIGFAARNLAKNGTLFLEINQFLPKETEQLLQEHNFMDIELRNDLYGNPRMLKGTVTNMP